MSELASVRAPLWQKLLLAIHLVCVTSWSLPNAPTNVSTGRAKAVGSDHILLYNSTKLKSFEPLYAYLFVTGTWQYWDMFAPNPSNVDLWSDAEVEFRDGTKRRYAYPRVRELPIPSKIPHERFRKFFERANSESFSYLWPQFALRIAHLNDNPENPPVTVRLKRHWLTIMPPGKPQPTDYNEYMYFEYAVDPRKLAEMRLGR